MNNPRIDMTRESKKAETGSGVRRYSLYVNEGPYEGGVPSRSSTDWIVWRIPQVRRTTAALWRAWIVSVNTLTSSESE